MSKKLLIVDDLQENRYMLRSLLEGHGYEVLEAQNGARALELARTDPPDAVVTDLMMPVMDGFALCRAWMQDDRLWRIPFIVYTATYTDPKDRRLVLDLGADAYIIKPAEPEALMLAIESALDRAKPKTDGRPEIHTAEFFERYARRLQEKLDRKIAQLADTRQTLVDYVTRCEAILNVSPLAIVSTEAARRIQAWNYAAECLLGYSEAEVLDRALDMIVPDDRIDEAIGKLEEAAQTKRIVRFETQLLHRDGSLLEVDIAISFLGANIGYVAAISDLTALREAAEEKQRLEEQLTQTRRMESIGMLAGGLAHDFNNLLTIINANAEILESDLKDVAQLQKYVSRISEAGARAASLTQQLLAFSRRQTMRSEVLDLNKVVREVQQMLGRLIGEDVEFCVRTAEDLGRIEADVSQLEQVIMNLAINARDAMRDGGRLVIETKNVSVDRKEAEENPPMRPGRYVMLTVTDTGCGMDQETKSRAFEPFFTTKEQGRGTGLGLATVYGIVRQNSGFILIDSEPDKGSTFKIYFQREDKPLTEKKVDAAQTRTKGGGETILIVEDNEMVRDVTRLILERAGYLVVEASNEQEAIHLAEKSGQAIDLLLTDVVMPTTNGFELAKRIFASQPAMKVVFISGYTHDIIAHHGVLSSEVSLVEKPYTSDQLTSVVRAVLDGEMPGSIQET